MDREIAGFVRENLFGGLEYASPSGLKVSQCWDDVLRNALLMLAFGAAAHEEVFAVDGARVRLARLAPRLPITFYRWITDADGETLLALNQYGYRNANFESVQIPADRLAVFTFNQEGANFFGRSMLRPAYMHWYIKHQLYRIDAIAGERNGLGVPTIEQGPDGSKEDREAAAKWVTQLAAHEKTGVSLPHGWKFSLKGVEGNVRDLYNSIQHHNIEISRTALAFFMNLGLGARAGGNRALGESQTDFFFLAVQATADHLARTRQALGGLQLGGRAALSDAGRLEPARPQLRPSARYTGAPGTDRHGGTLSRTRAVHHAGTGIAPAAGKTGTSRALKNPAD
jgi:hypothetical protein